MVSFRRSHRSSISNPIIKIKAVYIKDYTIIHRKKGTTFNEVAPKALTGGLLNFTKYRHLHKKCQYFLKIFKSFLKILRKLEYFSILFSSHCIIPYQ